MSRIQCFGSESMWYVHTRYNIHKHACACTHKQEEVRRTWFTFSHSRASPCVTLLWLAPCCCWGSQCPRYYKGFVKIAHYNVLHSPHVHTLCKCTHLNKCSPPPPPTHTLTHTHPHRRGLLSGWSCTGHCDGNARNTRGSGGQTLPSRGSYVRLSLSWCVV